MKRIALRGERGQGVFALVDDEDFDRLVEFNWYYHSAGYAVRTYMRNGKRKTVLMHREVMRAPKDMLVDHKDGNRLNNTRENLRLATFEENQRNKRGPKYKTGDGSSRYKGVYFIGSSWRAKIKMEGEEFYIGHYATEEEAARAYDIKASELFGEFAHLNGVSEDIVPVPLKKGQSSKYRGVIAHKGKFRAGCCQINLGTFEDEIEAAVAYNEKAKELFGPLAILNDIPKGWKPKEKPVKYRGICKRKFGGWEVVVYDTKETNYKAHYGGKFPTAEEAAKAYNELAIKILGDKAKLNNIGKTGKN